MAGRIQGGALGTSAGYPMQRRDRSLELFFGVPPESVRDDDIMFGTWGLDLWPGWNWSATPSNSMMGDAVFDWQPYYGGTAWAADIRFTGGKQLPYFIIGQCLDNLGAPVAGAIVELWLSATETLVTSQLSRSDGMYAFPVTDTATSYFVVAYKTAPQIGGVSIRNLVGAAA